MKDLLYEKICLLTMNRVFGYKPAVAHALIRSLGSAGNVFKLDEASLEQALGPFSRWKAYICQAELDASASELERLESSGYNFIGINEGSYPELLKECEDAPLGLYLRSDSPPGILFNERPVVSIVGTRDISPYGKAMCRSIVKALSETPSTPVIVSGLALGTDIEAHLAALDNGLPTIGVMATGVESVYPSRHIRHASRIASAPASGLITDYPPGTVPLAVNFLRRNRIIAGMSDATLLVESREKGGGMMTARLAFSYGRDVFALPGRLDDTRSGGCNQLIHEHIADSISSIPELTEALGLGRWKRKSEKDLGEEIARRYRDSLDGSALNDMLRIASLIREERGICMDDICSRLSLTYSRVATLTGLLESDRIIDIDLLHRCSINAKKV